MFERINNKTARSSQGFEVHIPNIHGVIYSEGTKTLTIEIEGGAVKNGKVQWLIYSDSLHGWNPPYELEHFTFSDKQRVLQNVIQALKILEMEYEIV